MLEKSNFWLKNKKKIVIIGIVGIVVLLAIFFIATSRKRRVFARGVEGTTNTATVSRGDIKVNITGSGTITPSDSKILVSEVAAEVLEIHVEEGDEVQKGDVLFVLDSKNLTEQINTKVNTVNNLSKNVNSYKEDIANLNVYASMSGYITNFNAVVGDSINKNSSICGIIDDSTYIVSMNYYYNKNTPINEGDPVKIFIGETFTYLDGFVSATTDLMQSADVGGQTQTIEIEINNPGYTLENRSVNSAVISTQSGVQLSSIGTGTIKLNNTTNLKSKSSGTIKELYIKNGSHVNKGDLIMVLENDDLYDSLETAQKSLSDANEELQNARDDYSLYTITAPFDGTITTVNILVGDNVRTDTQLAKIVNNNEVEFDIDVDELDILDLEVGQKAYVTIDAIEETATTPLEGEVTKVSIEGTTMSSVTSYPVTISLAGSESIRMGMNCSTEIEIKSATDVLVLPVEAINTKGDRYFVLMEDGSQREIEVGIYNEDYIEIVSGLEEGEKVKLPETVKATETTQESADMRGNSMMGGFSNQGMPSFGGGNMQGGGMPQMGGMR